MMNFTMNGTIFLGLFYYISVFNQKNTPDDQDMEQFFFDPLTVKLTGAYPESK